MLNFKNMRHAYLYNVFFLTLLLAASSAFAQPDFHTVAEERLWLKLLHYDTGWFGRTRSLVDRKDFFFSSTGAKSPLTELQATYEALRTISKEDKENPNQHAQCRFPARYAYLKSRFGEFSEDLICPDLLAWKKGLNAESVTLVFSSAYSHSPASLFGHTFLRLNARPDPLTGKKRSDLLDYGANFAAVTPEDENAIIYAWKGIMGGYPSGFSIAPYYMKLNEYVWGEGRDLWEYDLSLTPEQVARLTDHLWELLANATFDYWYLDENCSVQLLTLLEVANPNYDLSRFHLYAVPVETLKRVVNTGGVTETRWRPSLRKQLDQKFSLLTNDEREKINTTVESLSFPANQRAEFFEALNATLFYRKQGRRNAPLPAEDRLLRQTLLERSRLGGVVAEPPLEKPSPPPERAHFPIRAGFAFGLDRSHHKFVDFNARLGVHSLLDPSTGYTEFSQIEILSGKLRFEYEDDESSKLKLQELDFLHAISLSPINGLESRPSWKVRVGAWHFGGGVGGSVQFLNSHSLLSAFVDGHLHLGGVNESAHLTVGPEIQFLWQVVPSLKALSSLALERSFAPGGLNETSLKPELTLSWIPASRWSDRFSLGLNSTRDETALQLFYYF